MHTLEFERQARKGKPTHRYFDIIVSGKSLRDMLSANDRDLVTPFGWCDRNIEEDMIKEFKGEKAGQATHGRIMIYVCPECLDIACGSITAELEFSGDTVIWKNFGYENGYEEIDFDSFKHVHPIKFEKMNYLSKLSKL